MDRDAQGCVREAQDAPGRHRLTTTRHAITPEPTPGRRPRSPLSRNRGEHPPTALSDEPHAPTPRRIAHALSLTPRSPQRGHTQAPTARSGLTACAVWATAISFSLLVYSYRPNPSSGRAAKIDVRWWFGPPASSPGWDEIPEAVGRRRSGANVSGGRQASSHDGATRSFLSLRRFVAVVGGAVPGRVPAARPNASETYWANSSGRRNA